MPTLKQIVNEAFALHQSGDVERATSMFKDLLTAMPGEPIALEYLGVQAAQAGDFEKAIKLYKQATGHPRCRPSLHFQLGHALRDNGDLEAAVNAYQHYLGLEQDPGGAVSLGDVFCQLDKYEDAIQVLKNAIEWQPEHTKALCLLAMVYDQLERCEEARKQREQALQTSETHHEAVLLKGCALLDLGDASGAFKVVHPITNSLYGDQFTQVLQDFDKENPALPPVQGSLPDASDKPLVLAVGDLEYVQTFAPDLIRSAAQNSPSSDIHIHVILTEPMNHLPLQSNELPSFSLSWEVEPLADRTVFATRRFVRLAEWRQRLSQTVLAIDMDSRITGNIGQVLNELKDFDVAMRYRPQEIFLTQRVAAGFLALAPTGPAQDFIDSVAAYILHFEVLGESKWFVDQMALLAARLSTLGADDNPIRIEDIPDGYFTWDDNAPEALIWTAKGIHKASLTTK